MSSYAVGIGHDVPELNLVRLNPQPRSEGFQMTATTPALDGSVHEQGPYIPLVFDFKETPADYQALLAQFGLSATVSTANVTVRIPNNVYAWARYNGIAVRPEVGRDVVRENGFIRRITLLVKFLELAA